MIGGAALNLLGIVHRATEDCDIIYPLLPEAIVTAAREFAEQQRTIERSDLDRDWLNNGPASLVEVLPSGWEARLQPCYSGTVLTLRSLGRLDLIRSKLFAVCDRGRDLADCLALAPSVEELAAIQPWLAIQDLNPDWPAHVRSTLANIARRLHDAQNQ